MADLIITDSARKPIASLDDYELDLAYGSDENDFKLTCLPQPAAGSLIMMDGTEYGGMVTVRNTDGSVEGPTWHGMLSRRILQPDAGKDYLTVSGNAATILNTLFKRIGLDFLFTADASTVTIGGWQFDRYTDAYTGVTKMLTANNAKLRLAWLDGHVHAIAKPVDHYGDTIDSDLLTFQASLDSQPVNHLIGLGQGDLHERVVVHWYADANGKVSQSKTLTGLAEYTAIYDYSNAQADELNEKTKEKLEELQTQGGVSVTLNDRSLSMDVGDTVTGRDNRLGITITVPISKKIVKVNNGIMSVDYECGTADGVTTSLSGTAESGGSGATYYADGTTITMKKQHVLGRGDPEPRRRGGEDRHRRVHARIRFLVRDRQGAADSHRSQRHSGGERGGYNRGPSLIREQKWSGRAPHGSGGHSQRIRTHERCGQKETRRIGELHASSRHQRHNRRRQTGRQHHHRQR